MDMMSNSNDHDKDMWTCNMTCYASKLLHKYNGQSKEDQR